MFDIGFAELLLVAVVALLVVGPERLPGTVRGVAVVLRRLKRQAGEIRREIERELDIDGIRRDLHNEEVLSELKKGRESIEETLNETRRDLKDVAGKTEAKEHK